MLKPQIEESQLTFALMIDQGAVKWHSCYPNCSATTALLNIISYARQQGFFSSSAAIRDESGKTLVTQFGMEAYSINWDSVIAASPDLHWIFRNAGAFSDGHTVGAYGGSLRRIPSRTVTKELTTRNISKESPRSTPQS